MRLAIATGIALIAASTAASAQQSETVKSLLGQDFAVVGTITSRLGAGVFLQKKDKLFLCFVSETPTSTTITTRYCKPIE